MKALLALSALMMLSALIILASYGVFSAIRAVFSADTVLSISVSNNVVINVGASTDVQPEQIERVVKAALAK